MVHIEFGVLNIYRYNKDKGQYNNKTTRMRYKVRVYKHKLGDEGKSEPWSRSSAVSVDGVFGAFSRGKVYKA